MGQVNLWWIVAILAIIALIIFIIANVDITVRG